MGEIKCVKKNKKLLWEKDNILNLLERKILCKK